MRQFKSILTYGFATFVMFFGSGNLVFPLLIGYRSDINWLYGFIGLFFTGILLPFLGLFVIKLHRGNYYNFFGEAGRVAKFLLPLFAISLLGAFGVVPRCITVAHGGISYVVPELNLWAFSLIFSIISYFLCLKDQLMVKILGKWMSPLLLLILLVLIVCGAIESRSPVGISSEKEALMTGFISGYQTMDLFAAFFFSSLIFNQIHTLMRQEKNDREILVFAVKSSLIGSGLLGVIYFGLVFLGAHYPDLLHEVSPEHMLPAIVKHVMGSFAALFLALVMIISCLTTAVALNNIYARYLCRLLQLGDNRFPLILLVTTGVAFVISLLDFKAIAAFLVPPLEVSYPGLIFLTVSCIVTRKYQGLKTLLFWVITIGMVVYLCC